MLWNVWRDTRPSYRTLMLAEYWRPGRVVCNWSGNAARRTVLAVALTEHGRIIHRRSVHYVDAFSVFAVACSIPPGVLIRITSWSWWHRPQRLLLAFTNPNNLLVIYLRPEKSKKIGTGLFGFRDFKYLVSQAKIPGIPLSGFGIVIKLKKLKA